MDPSGLRAIAFGTSCLVASSGELTIRASSAIGTRTLDVTWLGELVRVELPDPVRDHLGPEQSVAVPATPVRSEPRSPYRSWREVTAILTDDGVVDGALRLVVHPLRRLGRADADVAQPFSGGCPDRRAGCDLRRDPRVRLRLQRRDRRRDHPVWHRSEVDVFPDQRHDVPPPAPVVKAGAGGDGAQQ